MLGRIISGLLDNYVRIDNAGVSVRVRVGEREYHASLLDIRCATRNEHGFPSSTHRGFESIRWGWTHMTTTHHTRTALGAFTFAGSINVPKQASFVASPRQPAAEPN